MNLLATAAIWGALGGLASPRAVLAGAEGKEAVGFDEVLPVEPTEKAPLEKAEERAPEKPRPPAEKRPEGPARAPRVRRLKLGVHAGGLFPLSGSGTDYPASVAFGAHMWNKLNSLAGIALVFDYARAESGRQVSDLFLLSAGLRVRLSGEDVSTCPLYAGFGAGFLAEDISDDYEGRLPGNLGLALTVRLGVRLGRSLDLGLGYVVLPDSENSPGAGLASMGYSF